MVYHASDSLKQELNVGLILGAQTLGKRTTIHMARTTLLEKEAGAKLGKCSGASAVRDRRAALKPAALLISVKCEGKLLPFPQIFWDVRESQVGSENVHFA